jgi:septal ring factor EnvC (AmiA/AmiB activator)
MGRRIARAPGSFVLAVVVAVHGFLALTLADDARQRRLDALQDEMKRLQREMAGLALREQGLLGDVARLDAEIALRRAELEDVSLRLRGTEERLTERARSRDRREQARAPQLAAHPAEMHARPAGSLAATSPGWITPRGSTDFATQAPSYARLQIGGWRSTSRAWGGADAVAERARLSLRSEASRKEAALTTGRASRASLLARIRGDREQHEQAFGELEAAARSLGRLVDSFEENPAHVALNVRAFRGLLDWPAAGAVSTKFGTVIHPRFKTEIPHPGLDIDAPQGQPFRSIFDGHVAYAAPLTGYGLTVVVDHGHGVLDYAHAEALLVAGEDVQRGRDLGRVGESARCGVPYFQLRDAGKPVDPSSWLRPR